MRTSTRRREEEDYLVICGHSHWDEPLAVLPGGAQVLNVDGRAVLLRRGG